MDGMNMSQVQQVQKREARGKGMENSDCKAGPIHGTYNWNHGQDQALPVVTRLLL